MCQRKATYASPEKAMERAIEVTKVAQEFCTPYRCLGCDKLHVGKPKSKGAVKEFFLKMCRSKGVWFNGQTKVIVYPSAPEGNPWQKGPIMAISPKDAQIMINMAKEWLGE